VHHKSFHGRGLGFRFLSLLHCGHLVRSRETALLPCFL